MTTAKRTAGIVGAIVGLAAAGVATGIAVERAVVRRSKRGDDPYADEPFDHLPYDEILTVTTADGTDIHVEVVEPTRRRPAQGDRRLRARLLPRHGHVPLPARGARRPR